MPLKKVRPRMTDIREQRIYCAEQIYVPENLSIIMKNYSKEVIRNQPENLVAFSKTYFEQLLRKRESDVNGDDQTNFSELNKPSSNQLK